MSEHGVDLAGAVEHSADEAFVEVMFARTEREAARCRGLLVECGIPARAQPDGDDIADRGVPVLVPPACLEEAAEVLATQVQDDDEGDDGLLVDPDDAADNDDADDDEDDDDFADEEDDEDDIECIDDD